MFNLNNTINKTRVWKKLEAHAKKMRNVEMRDMFDEDNKRAEKYSVSLENMWLDYSKNRIDEKAVKYLLTLAREAKVQKKIEQMFAGDKINITENRAVLHVALRNRDNTPIYVDGKDVMPEINRVLAKIKDFSEAVRLGKFKGYTGKKLTNIVNIGIGGSDLGPKMAVEALKKYMPKDMNCYFISNIDIFMPKLYIVICFFLFILDTYLIISLFKEYWWSFSFKEFSFCVLFRIWIN